MPVLRSGTYVLYGYLLTDHGALLDGDTAYGGDPGMAGLWGWQNFNTIFIIPFPTDVQFTGPMFLDTSTEGTGWDAGAPPPGFTIHTGLIGPTLYVAANTNCSSGAIGLDGTHNGAGMFGKCGAPSFQNDDPLLTYIELLDPYLMHLTNTVGLVGGGISKTAPWSTPTAGIRITGGYDIIAWWWKIPDKDDCQRTHTSKFELSTDQPPNDEDGGVYEKLDPDDSDAHPTPVIDEIEPNHGPIGGGTTITVRGSGFGKDFDLKVDGVSCTDLEYISQYEVTGVTPAHVIGSANVVLINADGVSS